MWGSLSPQYRLCSEGKRQSPVNIVNADAEYNPELIGLSRNYRASNATLVDNRYNIAVRRRLLCRSRISNVVDI